MLINTGNLQAQNDINLLPDTGNVGIGNANPGEKLEVTGNSILDGNVAVSDSMQVGGSMEVQQSLSVTDSLSVGSNVSIGSSLRIIDSLTVGSKVIVNQSMYVSDTLSIGSTLKVNEIKDVEKITTTSLKTTTLTGVNGAIAVFDPLDPSECDALVLDYCNRTIFGYKLISPGVEKYYGVSIGKNSRASNEYSFAAGNGAWAIGNSSIALGTRSRAMTEKSITIGTAADGTEFFNNNIANSLMVGFNVSNSKPSLFVGPSTITNLPGNVGIGTTTPADKLVIGDGYEQISFGSAMNDMNSGLGWFVGYMGMNATRTRANTWQSSVWTISGDNSAGYGGGVIATDAGGKMFIIPIATGANSTITITDEELYARRVVEIGAIDPTANPAGGMMRVNGKIWCKEVEVKIDPSFWWDDVFAPNYQLRSFEELEAFIALNGHLPDVPTEQEVSENGLSLGESYGTLLPKIEELTLCMLQLKKENEELRKLIESK